MAGYVFLLLFFRWGFFFDPCPAWRFLFLWFSLKDRDLCVADFFLFSSVCLSSALFVCRYITGLFFCCCFFFRNGMNKYFAAWTSDWAPRNATHQIEQSKLNNVIHRRAVGKFAKWCLGWRPKRWGRKSGSLSRRRRRHTTSRQGTVEYDDTLTVYYLLQKLETLETQMQEFNNRLTKMEDSAPSKKRSLPNESEVVIHQCITRFLTNWKRHFRCIHHYRNDCKYPALKCARIHDNTHDSDLSKEIRSLLLHSESAYLRNLIRQNKMGAARPACISMCEDLKATKSMYLAHLSKA
jgi:hypothetical protein